MSLGHICLGPSASFIEAEDTSQMWVAPLRGLDPELWKNEENSLSTSEHTGAIVSLSLLWTVDVT